MPCCMCKEYDWDDPQEVVYTDPEDGKEYCLFHAPAKQKGMSVDEFNAQVSGRIQATIDREDEGAVCDLDGTIFPGKICFDKECVLPNMSLRSCLFVGAAYFGSAEFGGAAYFGSAEFGGDADFSSAKFGGDAYFYRTLIGGDADFHEALIGGHAYFHEVSIRGHAFFQNAIIGGDAIFARTCIGDNSFFNNVTFNGNADFRFAKFSKDVFFDNASFRGFTDFGSSLFGGNVEFNKVKFAGNADFHDVEFRGVTNFSYIYLDDDRKVSIDEDKRLPLLEFSGCNLSSGSMNFQHCEDLTRFNLLGQYDLSHVYFYDCSWGELWGKIQKDTRRLQYTLDFCKRMKAKYIAENNESEEARWHLFEHEAELRLLSITKENPAVRVSLWLYKISSGYGENPNRAMAILLFLLILPLIVLIGCEGVDHFAWMQFDPVKIDHIIGLWIQFIPLNGVPIDSKEPNWLHALMLLTRFCVSLQAVLLAFALRKKIPAFSGIFTK